MRRRLPWVAGSVGLAALVGVVVQIGAASDDRPTGTTVATEPSGPAVGTQEFLARLAEQGYIPPQAVDRERLLLERLVERGLIPAESLD